MLIGSLAKLLVSFHMQSVLAFLQIVDAITGKVMSSMVFVLALKKYIAIPTSFMVLHQEGGHVVAYYPCCTRPHQVLKRTFCYQRT